MNRSGSSVFAGCLVALLACLFIGCAGGNSAHPAPGAVVARATDGTASILDPFKLTDQRGEKREVRFPLDRPLVITLADRAGSKQVAGWVEPVRRRFGESVRIEGVADLRAVPGFLRGLVRGQFAGLDYPVMLDWDGAVVGPAGYEGGAVAVWLVDREGNILWRGQGEVDEARLDVMVHRLDGLLRNHK
ncbi:MAG: hypothetical protein H7A46_22395 [Verrucomicrobiales bacterium]|nr:hypothetical protein [Verrucomicrobiales bacterium]